MSEALKSVRYASVDIMRGLAIAMMVVFHFCYDLNDFGYVELDFYHDPFWLHFRTLILSSFLLLVGVSLQLATMKGVKPKPYLRRLGQLITAAAAVSLGTYAMFGERMILFGVLHFIALASVLGLMFRRLYWSNLVLGVGLLLLDVFFQHAWFDQRAWHWIGFMTDKPVTLDYVPLVPWLGVVLIGMFLARLSIQKAWLGKSEKGVNNSLARVLALAGRHGLLIYLVHQPLLFGGFYALRWVQA